MIILLSNKQHIYTDVLQVLTVVLREYRDFNFTEGELKALLQYIADDIHNRNRQATAFSLLKSILSRDIVLPELGPNLVKTMYYFAGIPTVSHPLSAGEEATWPHDLFNKTTGVSRNRPKQLNNQSEVVI
eukprot:sb/3475149/